MLAFTLNCDSDPKDSEWLTVLAQLTNLHSAKKKPKTDLTSECPPL